MMRGIKIRGQEPLKIYTGYSNFNIIYTGITLQNSMLLAYKTESADSKHRHTHKQPQYA